MSTPVERVRAWLESFESWDCESKHVNTSGEYGAHDRESLYSGDIRAILDMIEPIYRVGEPDPYPIETDTCESWHGLYICTLPNGHIGRQHAASTGITIVEVWED